MVVSVVAGAREHAPHPSGESVTLRDVSTYRLEDQISGALPLGVEVVV